MLSSVWVGEVAPIVCVCWGGVVLTLGFSVCVDVVTPIVCVY